MTLHMHTPIDTLTPLAADGAVTLVQFSDPHLLSDPSQHFLGMNPAESLAAVLAEIAQEPAVDALLATGDLSQDHLAGSYQLFAQLLSNLTPPTFALPGNHDVPALMTQVFTNSTIQIGRCLVLGSWQILMLNSTVEDAPAGELSGAELGWLTQVIEQHPERYTIVALHHNPILTGCSWLDQHCLRNGNELLALMGKYPHVKAVIWGHVHQQMEQQYLHVQLLGVPATSVQFKPQSAEFALDAQPPGYRVLHLSADGQIQSTVKRLEAGRFVPHLDVTGY
ncbi:MAG: 3',5'-cyclic-AMP phosphodiesterase [Ferrimonas sp.]